MQPALKQILSASRRTDIPAFYMPWLMKQVERGTVSVVNPYNRRVRQVDLRPAQVDTIVFWSKNFGPFLDSGYGSRLQQMGYHLFFNFTINAPDALLEPAVPSLGQRLDQLARLSDQFGAPSVQWRFDPICHYRLADGTTADNLADFAAIARAASRCGVGICISSFMDHYRKIDRRTTGRLTFIEPDREHKTEIVREMEATLAPLGIDLTLCCEKEVLAALPADSTVTAAACISADRIMAVHGTKLSRRRDSGQRRSAGCGCSASVDVGAYDLHPCHHNCLFCYANPVCDQRDSP